jgi:hypothetical protein
MPSNNNANEFVQQIKNSLLTTFISSLQSKESKIKRISRQTVIDFQAYETGRLADATTALFKYNKNSIIITFLTYDVKNSTGNNYSIFPYYGLSTSAKYGERKWLEESALHTLQLLDVGYYTSTLKRGGGRGLK